jgi:PAS domain S-box-containing protein
MKPGESGVAAGVNGEVRAEVLHDGPIAVVTFDGDVRCTFLNGAAQRLVGRTNEECVGKGIQDFVSHDGDELARCEVVLRDTLANRRARRYEVTYGAGRFCVVLYPTSDSNNDISGLVCVGLDVSDVTTHAPVGDNRPSLRDRILPILVHELRNPLSTMRSGLKIMEISSSEDQIRSVRAMMERQLAHLTRLVHDVLDLSRVNEGRLSLQRQPVLISDVVNLAIEMSGDSLKAGDHALRVVLPDTGIEIQGDSTRLAQVVSNLLDNASKYTPKGGAISLTVTSDENDVVLQVSDTGLGIPAERLDEIFTLFSQIDDHQRFSRGGLGIGLYLVKAIVDGHGGTVRAESDGDGKGAVFTVRLPMGRGA